MEQPELRPLRVTEIFDVSIKLYTRNAAVLIKIVALVLLPVAVMSFFVVLAAIPEGVDISDGQFRGFTDTNAVRFFGITLLVSLIGGLATLIAVGASFRAVGDAYLGGSPDAGESLRFAAGRLLSILWVTILFFVGLVFFTLLLILPGIYIAVAWSIAVPALLVEDARGFKALSRSFRLISGRWWPTFGLLLIGFVLVPFAVQFVLGALAGVAIYTSVESVTAYQAIDSSVGFLISLITTPLQVAILSVLYFDLRVRREGFDLALLAERIGLPPEGPYMADGMLPPQA